MKKNNKKSKKKVENLFKDFQDYYFNEKGYANEIFEKCSTQKIKDFCEYGYFSFGGRKESIPAFYYELDMKRVFLDMAILGLDFEEWVHGITSYLNEEGDKRVFSKISYYGDGEDKPCLFIYSREVYNKYVNKAS